MVIPPNVKDFWKDFVALSGTISDERFYEAFAFWGFEGTGQLTR